MVGGGGEEFAHCRVKPVADPDLQIVVGGGGVGGHLDPEIRGKPGLKKFFFRPYGPQFGLKLRGKGGGSPGLLPRICHWKHEVAQNTYIPTPMPFSCIFLLNTVSILPCVNEYSNINTSKMNATNILKIKEKEFFFLTNYSQNSFP